MAPLCFYFAYRNSFVKDVLFNGWSPVIIAMAISSVGGFILDIGVKNYKVLVPKHVMLMSKSFKISFLLNPTTPTDLFLTWGS